MVEYGTRIIGLTRSMSEQARLDIGAFYQINVQATQGIIDPKGVADYLLGKLREQYPEYRIVWMSVCEKRQTITLQFTPVPAETLGYAPQPHHLFIVSLLAWLPAVLTLLGIGVAAISIYSIIGGVPWYVWALLGTGVVLLLFGPTITKLITARAPEQYRPVMVFR